MNAKIYIFIILALIVFVSVYQQKKHTSQHAVTQMEIAERIALAKLEELTKDMPASVTYALSEGPKEMASGRALYEFVYSPNVIPYPADGKIRNWSIVIVVDAGLKTVEYYQIGDNEAVFVPYVPGPDTHELTIVRDGTQGRYKDLAIGVGNIEDKSAMLSLTSAPTVAGRSTQKRIQLDDEFDFEIYHIRVVDIQANSVDGDARRRTEGAVGGGDGHVALDIRER